MNEGGLAIDLDFEEGVEVAGFDGGLFGGEDFNELDVVALKGELEEVVWVGLDEVFGEGVNGWHRLTLSRQNLCQGRVWIVFWLVPQGVRSF